MIMKMLIYLCLLSLEDKKMQKETLLKKIQNEIKTTKTLRILVDHVKTKTPTALDGFEIINFNLEENNDFLVFKHSVIEKTKAKEYKTINGVINFINKSIEDYQQGKYAPLEFKIKKGY